MQASLGSVVEGSRGSSMNGQIVGHEAATAAAIGSKGVKSRGIGDERYTTSRGQALGESLQVICHALYAMHVLYAIHCMPCMHCMPCTVCHALRAMHCVPCTVCHALCAMH